MMETKHGDILTVKSGLILQQVNAQGVMGSGIAKSIRDMYPKVFDDYSAQIKTNPTVEESRAHLGKVIFSDVSDELSIVNIVGQQFYRVVYDSPKKRYTSYDALDFALGTLEILIRGHNADIHFPLIGCDRGGAEWSVVSALIQHHLKDHKLTLWLYKP